MLTVMDNPGPHVLVSACLLGRECRYDGCHNQDQVLETDLLKRGEVPIPFCPEEEGGLPTPRPAAWVEAESAHAVLEGRDRIVTGEGQDVTPAFMLGARAALDRCRELNVQRAYLKERSPSCGVQQTHVNGELTQGPGVTAALLEQHGIQVIGVEGKRQE
ncbi:MAG: hypothetical protein ACI9F9_001804 [Candidatus Paceibacteria bacterium]|jgi:uncharacterized protein YbbK (DUF523 family)